MWEILYLFPVFFASERDKIKKLKTANFTVESAKIVITPPSVVLVLVHRRLQNASSLCSFACFLNAACCISHD